MRLHLGGSLAWYDEQKRSKLDVPIPANQSISLNALLQRFSIPRGEVAIISINGDLFDGEDIFVSDTDTVMLYPPIGGGRLMSD